MVIRAASVILIEIINPRSGVFSSTFSIIVRVETNSILIKISTVDNIPFSD
jgi:hypothetical protein